MGDAKRRGTPDERVTAAREGIKPAMALIERGLAPHYTFILDRSPAGLAGLAAMRAEPQDLHARANSSAMKFWEASHFPYVVIWGTWGYSGGLTMPALNLSALLDEALPVVMARLREKGGLCAFFPIVDKSVEKQITDRLAQLQPTIGPPLQ